MKIKGGTATAFSQELVTSCSRYERGKRQKERTDEGQGEARVNKASLESE